MSRRVRCRATMEALQIYPGSTLGESRGTDLSVIFGSPYSIVIDMFDLNRRARNLAQFCRPRLEHPLSFVHFSPMIASRPTDTLPLPCGWQQPELRIRVPSGQSNRPACGGARLLGNGGASIGRAFSFRWVSIFSMTTGSSMQAITLTEPPHLLHVSMSILKTRLRQSRR